MMMFCRRALKYIVGEYSSDFDWFGFLSISNNLFFIALCCRFVKADDETYVAVKNLKAYVSQFDSQKDHFFGLAKLSTSFLDTTISIDQ